MYVEAAMDALRHAYQAMPPVRAMQVEVEGYQAPWLKLRAPLAANVNDKGTAFGGSLCSLMTIAGWGLLQMRLSLEDLRAEIYVADSQVRYLTPLRSQLQARARLRDDGEWAEFMLTLRRRGRARTQVLAQVDLDDGQAACTLEGRFVAIAVG